MQARVKSGPSAGERVAIKVFDPELALAHATRAGELVAENADAELAVLRLAAQRPHPHLMGMHAAGTKLRSCSLSVQQAADSGHQLMAVLPWCGRGDLMSVLQNHGSGFAQPTAARIFTQVVSAVQHLHGFGYCHRDVSLENIFCVDDPATREGFRVLVGDFGGCAPVGWHKAPTVRPGKVAYACPEIFGRSAAGYDGQKADVYSLGVVLFCLLAGCMPYERPVLADACYAIIRRGDMAALVNAWGLASQFDGVLPLVQRMISANPSQRPSLEEVLAHPFCAPHVRAFSAADEATQTNAARTRAAAAKHTGSNGGGKEDEKMAPVVAAAVGVAKAHAVGAVVTSPHSDGTASDVDPDTSLMSFESDDAGCVVDVWDVDVTMDVVVVKETAMRADATTGGALSAAAVDASA